MRIAFAGTPPFAARALQALIEAGHDIPLVLTQPDRPSGRGMKLKPSAVKALALEHGIPVLTPLTLSVARGGEEAEAALAALEACQADILVVAAYGLILPERALNAAHGIGADGSIRSMNIHGSLLPRWRGAAPVQRAIEAGDAQTGVCLMRMEKGLDTGPVILSRALPITPDDTGDSLTERLAELGAAMTVESLLHPESLTCTAQPEEGVLYAHKLLKTESPVDWTQDAAQVARKIQAFHSFPSVTARRGDETFKIHRARAVSDRQGPAGTVLEAGKTLVIACGTGAVVCTELQKAGKPVMPAAAFIQSMKLVAGEVLQ